MYQYALLISVISSVTSTLLDLSHPMNDQTTNWPQKDAKKYSHSILTEVENAGSYYISKELEFTEHLGTHIDSPFHFSKKAWDTASIPIEKLIVPVVKIDVRDKCAKDRDYVLTVNDVEGWVAKYGKVPKNAVILMETGWSDKYGNWAEYYGSSEDMKAADFDYAVWSNEIHFPGFSIELAKTILTNYTDIAGIGLDTPSVDPGTSAGFEVHNTLYPKNIYGLENLCCLRDVPEQGATLMVFPPRVEGGTGFPVRVVVDTDSSYAYKHNSGVRVQCGMFIFIFVILLGVN